MKTTILILALLGVTVMGCVAMPTQATGLSQQDVICCTVDVTTGVSGCSYGELTRGRFPPP